MGEDVESDRIRVPFFPLKTFFSKGDRVSGARVFFAVLVSLGYTVSSPDVRSQSKTE